VTDAPANRLEATMQAEIEALRREVEALRGERAEARRIAAEVATSLTWNWYARLCVALGVTNG
jgi:hypothetical protein